MNTRGRLEKLAKGILDCYENARKLIDDAKLLYKHRRYARSVALAIIALEEFGKAESLYSLINTAMTAKEIKAYVRKIFINHREKQLAACEREFLRTMKGKTNFYYHIQVSKNFIEKEKESSLYVDMNSTFDFKSPASIKSDRARKYIAFVAEKIYEYKFSYKDILDRLMEEREWYEDYSKDQSSRNSL
ncbi:MAG: AbiV family abortive infection protein [Candidatus Omnitrophica bacterium]|nr:AbiV family abortive infection protein [Candidatus Omnitrophota bacterium]